MGFDEQIEINQWVRRVGHAGQQKVDNAVAAYRRNELPLEGTGTAILPSIAAISSELDNICERLAGSPQMSVEFAEDLLRLDAVAHALRRVGKNNGSD